MLVDDESDILNILRTGLARYGHKVMAFSDPMLALKEFAVNHSDYALILTDLRMPAMSGLQLAIRAKEIDADVKLMVMTAFELSSYELSHEVPYVRLEDVLKKPFSLSNICKVIDKKVAH